MRSIVDRNRIGVICICGFGGMRLNAAAIDKRVKAVAVASMYDMSRVMAKGYDDELTIEQFTQTLEQLGTGTIRSATLGRCKERCSCC